MTDYAHVLKEQEKFTEAETYYLQAIEIERDVLGELDPDHARTLGQFATMKRQARQFDEAIEIVEKILQLQEKNFGQDSMEYASALRRMSYIYMMISAIMLRLKKFIDKLLRLQGVSLAQRQQIMPQH